MEITKRVYASAGTRLKKYNLTFFQYQILMLLCHDKTLSMSTIKKALLISQSAVTTITDKLVRKGLVKRYYDTKDRRKVMITITKNGEGMLKKLLTGHEDFIGSLSKKIGRKKLETLQESLKILLESLNTRMEK